MEQRTCAGHQEDSASDCAESVVGSTDYCRLHGSWFEADIRVFEAIQRHYLQDIQQFWQRSNFFLLIQGALISVYLTSAQDEAVRAEGVLRNPVLWILPFAGMFLALAWWKAAQLSWSWLGYWSACLKESNRAIDRYQRYLIERPQKGPEEITKLLPLALLAAWPLLAATIFLFFTK